MSALEQYVNVKTPSSLVVLRERYHFDVTGPFLMVTVTRFFENRSNKSIEAISVFPVPVMAAVSSLVYRRGSVVFHGVCQKKSEALDTYETAISDGKTAVLHEEVLRGIHKVSMGNLDAGQSANVSLTYAVPVQSDGTGGVWRLPMTIASCYGPRLLTDEDDVTETALNPVHADITYSEYSKSLGLMLEGEVNHKMLITHRLYLRVPDISVLLGHIETRIQETLSARLMVKKAVFTGAYDLTILADISASMNCENKYKNMTNFLRHVPVQEKDSIDLWWFNSDVGRCEGKTYAQQVHNLNHPNSGTNIGEALQRVILETESRDILIITDGRSNALDIDSFVGCGRRISVLFIGRDALEARIGHVAALTGGHIVCVDDVAQASVLYQALRSHSGVERYQERGEAHSTIYYGGLCYHYTFQHKTVNRDSFGAAAIMMNLCSFDNPTELCLATNLVSHLTSLVLVDDTSDVNTSHPVPVRMQSQPMFASALTRSVNLNMSGVSGALSTPVRRHRSERFLGMSDKSKQTMALDHACFFSLFYDEIISGHISDMCRSWFDKKMATDALFRQRVHHLLSFSEASSYSDIVLGVVIEALQRQDKESRRFLNAMTIPDVLRVLPS